MIWLTVSVDGRVERRDGKPSLADLQKVVGGYIEAIDIDVFGKSITMYLNEEGKLVNLPENAIASLLAQGSIANWDYIAGDVALIGPPDDEGENTSLPPSLADALVTMTGRVVRVYLNDDQTGEHWMGYRPGHPLKFAIQYVTPNALPANEIVEKAFERFNIGEDRLAQTYRARGNRSLSVGDVISVNGEWFACEMLGWSPIDKPEGVDQ